MLGGLWEFPGGKIKPEEQPKGCVKREIKEELNIDVSVDKKIKTIKHAYSHFTIELTAYNCQYVGGTPLKKGCANFKWIKPKEVEKLPFPKANRKFINDIPESNPCNFSA